MTDAPRARRDVLTFLGLLALLSSGFYALVFLPADGARRWSSYMLPFMWCPGLAAILTKLVRDRSLRGLGWGPGRARYLSIAYGVAVATCLLAYLPVWLALDAFDGGALSAGLAKLGLPAGPLGVLGLLAGVLLLSPLASLVSAAGEEIGWRGFLVPRMSALMGATGTSLVVGLIWAAWHYPINVAVFPLYRPHVPLWYANACFTVVVVAISFVHTWLRVRSRSLWPSALLHAAGNAFQGTLQLLTVETRVTSYWTSEYGAAFALAACLVAFLVLGRRGAGQPENAASEADAMR